MRERANIHSLDGFRALSVLIVAASHCGFGHIVPGGLGVTVFFFLSGFLITHLLSEEYARSRTIDLPAFFLKRFFRLTPPLLALLAASAALVAVGALGGRITLAGLAAQALYLTNYYSLFWDTGNTTAAGTGILWSLAVEEHFYLVFPMSLLFLLGRCSRKSITGVIAAACLGILAWRMILAAAPGFDASRTYYSTDTRIDSILYGCLLAVGWNPLSKRDAMDEREAAATGRLVLAAGLLLLCATIIVRGAYFRETFRYSLQGLALMLLFHAVLRTERGLLHGLLNHPAATALGRYSYAFYLVHFVVENVLTRNTVLGETPALLFATVIAISCMLAAAMHRLVERPALRLRTRVFAALGAGAGASDSTAADSRFAT